MLSPDSLLFEIVASFVRHHGGPAVEVTLMRCCRRKIALDVTFLLGATFPLCSTFALVANAASSASLP